MYKAKEVDDLCGSLITLRLSVAKSNLQKSYSQNRISKLL